MFDPALSSKEPHADKPDSPGGPRTRMNVSPLDLRQQRFRTTMRGFDKVEVASFLAAVADDYEQALRETDHLRQDLTRMEAAQVCDHHAGPPRLLLEKTQARLEDVQREIDGLKLKRRDVETTLEATIQTLRNTLEYVREQESHERDERILLHRPRLAETPEEQAPERRRVQS